VYGPDRKLGAVYDDEHVVDLNAAFAKLLAETRDEPHPYLMAAAVVPAELGAFIESGQRAIVAAQEAIDYLMTRAGDRRGLRGEALVADLSQVKRHAPYASHARLMMAGGNYVTHSQGMSFRGSSGERASLAEVYEASRKRGIWGFYCFTENAVGPDEDVVYPTMTDRLDYEGEIAVVLGKRGKDISADNASAYFWGYMLQNDVSCRTQVRGPDNPQSNFARRKNFDTSVCGGPYVVVGEFGDAQNISWETRVNGEIRQQGNTKDMSFSFAELAAYLSEDLTLRPGDVISAGTGSGTAQDSSEVLPGVEYGGQPVRAPERFLKPGDVVEVSNPRLGTLRNQIVAKPT
jgi:2-keto-4-pentenoate hydratase/2-oxohepta-3-ene-1,7-dioic acid hydratase in catechol pathway